MPTRALLFIGLPEPFDEAIQAWRASPLFTQRGGAMLSCYCRQMAGLCTVTNLIMPERFAGLPGLRRIVGLNLHTYRHAFGDGSFGRVHALARTRETILVDAVAMPQMDLEIALAVHRAAGIGMSVFCGTYGETSRAESDRAVAGGRTIHRALRRFVDYPCRISRPRPLAVVLSRRTFRPDPTAPIAGFAALTRHLDERIRRAGDDVRWLAHPAVRTDQRTLMAATALDRTGSIAHDPCPEVSLWNRSLLPTA